jgi:hypothetical protein
LPLLRQYGWPHQEAGKKYPAGEMSFRQTIHGGDRSDRGFMVVIDRKQQKVLISFDAACVDPRHRDWLASVGERVGPGQLDPQPYWGFADLEHKAGTKLLNAFYVQAEVKTERGQEYYWYTKATMLQRFSFPAFLRRARTGEGAGRFRRAQRPQPRHQIPHAPGLPADALRESHRDRAA